MRILYHHRTLAEDAQGVHIEEITRALGALGHTVREASLVKRGGGSGSDGASESNGSGGHSSLFWRVVARVARGPIYEGLEPATRRLDAEIREFRPHLLYERYALSTVAGIRAARRHGVPHVLEVNAPLVLEKEKWSRIWGPKLARRVESWIFRNADRVVVVSEVLGRFVEQAGASPDRIVVIPNGADAEQFRPDLPADEIRARYGLGDSLVLGFVGWFRPWHDVESVVDALAHPALAERGVRLLLVGDGPSREAIESRAAERGVAERVHVTGPVSRADMPAHVAAFDIALQPAATEYACPMKIPEYFACGKPVVGPDQPNIRELVSEGAEGLLFPPGDGAALADALVRLVTDDALRQRLSEGARRRVVEGGMTWLANARRIVELEGAIRAERLTEAAPR